MPRRLPASTKLYRDNRGHKREELASGRLGIRSEALPLSIENQEANCEPNEVRWVDPESSRKQKVGSTVVIE